MSCTNCYNGCVEITSDKCVKYTGVNVPELGIETGDTLLHIEESLITFLLSALDGTGIKLDIDSTIICEIVHKHLVECEELTLVNVINALIKAVCELDERVVVLEDKLAALEGPYAIRCLSVVTPSSGTHAILQATINKLCDVEIALNALALNVSTNYVKLADLNSLIAAYLASVGTSTKYYNKMVPYVAVEYYGGLTGKFDVTGAGIVGTDWEKIYLCNGNNGTPDKRGRVPVGVTDGTMGGGAFDPAVDPGISGNPNYTISGVNSKQGFNSVSLSTLQIPAHSHTTTTATSVTDHTHLTVIDVPTDVTLTSSTPINKDVDRNGPYSYNLQGGTGVPNLGKTNPAKSDVTVSVNVNSTGGGLGHPNYQPGLGCYYIMYIP
jgi:microcystin-dependent protein